MERKRSANRKLAETTQKHFLLMISASGDKVGILTPPRASCLGPMSVLKLWTGKGGSCLVDAPARGTEGGGFGLQGCGSAMDPLWTRGAEDAVCERSARVMNSDRAVEAIRSDLSLQPGKCLPGVAGSRLCMPQGRALTGGSILYGTRTQFRSSTLLESLLGAVWGLGSARGSAPGFGSPRRSSSCLFLWQGFAWWILNIWIVGVVLDVTQGCADGSVTPSVPCPMDNAAFQHIHRTGFVPPPLSPLSL